ncbi:MAG: hypothetical protein HOQ36_18190 [Nocardia sp.]|nr:hypothetical protein [Nocardia sp.]
MARDGLRRVTEHAEDIRNSPRMSGKWGYVCTALGGVVVFILMFKHWMVAHGPDGMAAATPFGQVDSTTRYLTVWSSQGTPPAADLTGSWAVTASSMIALTIAAIAIHIATNSERFARIATGGAVITALLVIANMLYLTARQKQLKNMTIRRWDLGGQVGSWINWAVNDGSKPVAGLNEVEYVASGTITTAAIAAVIIAVGSAVIAVATMPRSTTGSRMPWRVTVSRETSADYTATRVEPSEDVPTTAASDPAPPTSPLPPVGTGVDPAAGGESAPATMKMKKKK